MLVIVPLSAQVKIGDNPTTIDDGSMLEVESTTKAFVPPRMTTAQMNAIPTPLEGSIIYNTTENCLHQYKQTDGWVSTCASDIKTINLTGTTNVSFNSTVIDVPGVSYTFTPTQDGVLIVNAHGIALPISTSNNSSQGSFSLIVNGAHVDDGYYSTFDGQILKSLGTHVPLTYTASIEAGTSYTIKMQVRQWFGYENDQVNPDLSVYGGAIASDVAAGKSRLSITFIPQN